MPVRSRLAALVLCAALAACNRYVAVAATELPRLAATPSPRWVHTLDGELVEVSGEFDVIVRTARGDYAFARPVAAWFAPGALVVAGADRRTIAFPLHEVRQVEVKQFSAGRTIALIAPISAVALVLLLLGTGQVGH
jgi:hypothetical protein